MWLPYAVARLLVGSPAWNTRLEHLLEMLHSNRLLVVFTTVRLLKSPLNMQISKNVSKALFSGDLIHY